VLFKAPMDTPKPRLDALQNTNDSAKFSIATRAYSAFVKKLRIALPVSVLVIVTILLIWPKIEIELSQQRFAPVKTDTATLEKAARENRLSDAKFSSVDAKGRPFTISAAQAFQDNTNSDVVQLTTPQGSIQTSDTQDMQAKAATGVYLQKDQILELRDDVVITRSDGTIIKTATLKIDLKLNDLSTQSAITITSPQGDLQAANMTSKNNGAVTIFGGPVRLELKPKNSIHMQGGAR
jgi:lipopolysaccharide export system protein LptC